MKFGDKITISNIAEKTRLHPYPIEYESLSRGLLSLNNDLLNWDEFPDMGELITHYAMIGYWPLSEIQMVTCYRRMAIEPIEVLFIGKRYVSIGVTGEIIIIYPGEYYDNQSYMSGEKKFIPIYNLELLLCVKNGQSNPFLSLQDSTEPKLIFNHEPYKKHMKDNIVVGILCDQHENHKKTWDDYYKKWECDLCKQPQQITTDDEIPF